MGACGSIADTAEIKKVAITHSDKTRTSFDDVLQSVKKSGKLKNATSSRDRAKTGNDRKKNPVIQ
jgi:hypothetical protein